MGKTIPLLKQLAANKLPTAVDDYAEREAVKLLIALGWVTVMGKAVDQAPIIVQEVTFAGKATLAIADLVRAD